MAATGGDDEANVGGGRDDRGFAGGVAPGVAAGVVEVLIPTVVLALLWSLSLSMVKGRQTGCGVTTTVEVTKGEEPM